MLYNADNSILIISDKCFRYTKKDTTVYAIVLKWPGMGDFQLTKPVSSAGTVVTLLGYEGKFNWNNGDPSGIVIEIPPIAANKMPCQWAWVFKLTSIAN